MARTLSLPFFLITQLAAAQPVLNFADVGTLPGDSFLYHASTVQPASTPGANQTWDFTTLDTDSLIPIVFADPDTTPDGASFPTATIAAGASGAYAYSNFDLAGGNFLGMSVPGEAPIVYSDPMQWATFPSTFGTTWTDNFGATFSIGGFPVTRTGTVTAEADGYGTMIMPYGTLNDVLRVSYVEDYSDMSIVTITTHREYTHYLQAGTRYPIAEQYTYTVSGFGTPVTTTGMNWMEVDISTGLPVTMSGQSAVSVFPVPASDAITVQLPAIDAMSTLELIDAQGRVVLERSVSGATATIPVDGLEAGAYALRVQQGESISTHRVVVQ